MSAPTPADEKLRKEVYGDPIRFRLTSEYWYIVDDLVPEALAGNEFLAENTAIDDEWRATIRELGILTLKLKYSIMGFTSLLTKEDADNIRPFNVCFQIAMKREGRHEVQRGVMDGRAELFARYRLSLEDRVMALYIQTLDIRAVAFRNRMWDYSHKPNTQAHGARLS